MTIKLSDKKENKLQSATQAMYDALSSEETEVQKQAFEDYSLALAESMEDSVNAEIAKYESARDEDTVMANRANRLQMTPKEKKFFAEAVEKQTVDGLDELFPRTIIETIMQDLSQEHPYYLKLIRVIPKRQLNTSMQTTQNKLHSGQKFQRIFVKS